MLGQARSTIAEYMFNCAKRGCKLSSKERVYRHYRRCVVVHVYYIFAGLLLKRYVCVVVLHVYCTGVSLPII